MPSVLTVCSPHTQPGQPGYEEPRPVPVHPTGMELSTGHAGAFSRASTRTYLKGIFFNTFLFGDIVAPRGLSRERNGRMPCAS
jgi:hypothetical protein